jgi:TonB-linked SusC/RagA family outer membrane protein
MRKTLLSALLVSPILLQQVAAQNREISGRVTDATTGQGLPGVTVLVKGTTTGASTDSNGSFTLSAPTTASTLVFSSIGYASVERAIGSNTTFNIALGSSARNLDEVVVTGLASSVKRSNMANSVATISAKELVGTTRPVTVDAALNGKLAGVNITQNSGAPGGGLSVQIRGISTLGGASSQPLYVIDGVYVNNSQLANGAGAGPFTGAGGGQDQTVNRLSDLNPNDIESIEVLKGPSAAALYGTRGNAGVIIIKTKRGAAGRPRISVSQEVGFAKALNLLGKEDWTESKIDTYYGAGATAEAEKVLLRNATAAGKIYDYEKEIFGNTGVMTTTNASIAGGSDNTKFFVGGSTSNEAGIVKRTGFQRNSIRLNLDQKVGKLLDISVSSNFLNSSNKRGFTGNDNNGISYSYNLAYTPSYHELHQNPDGTFPNARNTPDNLLAVIDRGVNQEKTNRFLQGGSVTLHILERESASLRLALQGGLDYSNTESLLYLPSDLQSQRGLANPGASRLTRNQLFFSNMQGFLIYDWKLLDGALALTSQVGVSRLNRNATIGFSQGVGLLPEQDNPNNGTVVTQDTYFEEQHDVGLVAQQELNFGDKVIVTGGIRFDKTSTASDVTKYQAFPKGSVAINLTKFGFWSVDPINQFKLRAAYGQTGGVPSFGATFNQLVRIGIGGRLGLIPSTTIAYDQLQQERAQEIEVGADISFLDSRVALEATAYQKDVKNLLRSFPLAPGTGVSAITLFPVGDLRNRGIELGLSVVPVRNEFLNWTSNNQIWFNRSEVTRSVIPISGTGSGFGNSYGRNLFLEGVSPSRWFGTPADPNGPLGLTAYEDAQPKFQFSSNNSFVVAKNVELSFLLHWKHKGYISNLSQDLQDAGGTTKDWSQDDNGNGTVNGQERLETGALSARQYIQDGSYVRLRELGLAYNVPSSIRTMLFKEVVQSMRFSVSAYNLVTWTKYTGYDPEVSNFGNVANGAFVDVSAFPNTRRLMFQVALGF